MTTKDKFVEAIKLVFGGDDPMLDQIAIDMIVRSFTDGGDYIRYMYKLTVNEDEFCYIICGLMDWPQSLASIVYKLAPLMI